MSYDALPAPAGPLLIRRLLAPGIRHRNFRAFWKAANAIASSTKRITNRTAPRAPSSPRYPPTMLRQALSTSTRALRSAPRLAASKPLPRPQFQTAPSTFLLRAAQPAVVRWYSDAKEAPAEEAKENAEAKEAGGESDAVAELKKALEAKDNEAKEWKVRFNLRHQAVVPAYPIVQ